MRQPAAAHGAQLYSHYHRRAGALIPIRWWCLQNMVFRSKQTTMQSSVSVMVSALSGLDVLTEKNVAQAMTVAEEAAVSRVLVTDADGIVLYDDRETGGAVGRYALYTEIVEALGGYDAFHSRYEDGAFRSRAASPVVYRGQIIGAVYAYEYDMEQAELLGGLPEEPAQHLSGDGTGGAAYQSGALQAADGTLWRIAIGDPHCAPGRL